MFTERNFLVFIERCLVLTERFCLVFTERFYLVFTERCLVLTERFCLVFTERFCDEFVAEAEHFGKWSSGTNTDER